MNTKNFLEFIFYNTIGEKMLCSKLIGLAWSYGTSTIVVY